VLRYRDRGRVGVFEAAPVLPGPDLGCAVAFFASSMTVASSGEKADMSRSRTSSIAFRKYRDRCRPFRVRRHRHRRRRRTPRHSRDPGLADRGSLEITPTRPRSPVPKHSAPDRYLVTGRLTGNFRRAISSGTSPSKANTSRALPSPMLHDNRQTESRRRCRTWNPSRRRTRTLRSPSS